MSRWVVHSTPSGSVAWKKRCVASLPACRREKARSALPRREARCCGPDGALCIRLALVVSEVVAMASPVNVPQARDLMAPDTEPTDEELAAVMVAARDLAVQRRALSDAWIAARLEEAARTARAYRTARKPGPGGS